MSIQQFLPKVYGVVVEPLLYLLFAVSVVIFIGGIVKFIRNRAEGNTKDDGKGSMIWGIVGMLIMVSAFGIIHIILGTINVPAPSSGAQGDIEGTIDKINLQNAGKSPQ